MSIKSIWKSLTGNKVAAVVIELTDAQKAVAALKNTTVGTAVAADIKALASSTMSGTEKFEAVVKNTMPLLTDLLATGGMKKAEAEVADIAREFVQSIFNTVASKKAETIGSLLLKVLGLK